MEQLGLPPVWSVHLSWAGIQRGILREQRRRSQAARAGPGRSLTRNESDGRCRGTSGPRLDHHSRRGSVDAGAIEAAAHGLASAGLGWDGARLAGHGAEAG